MILDETDSCRLATSSMTENFPWQQRLKAAGLTQRALARLLGHTDTTVSAQLREHRDSGVSRHLIAAIVAWELMTPEMREEWVRIVNETASSSIPETSGGGVASDEVKSLKRQVRELTRRLSKLGGNTSL